MVKYQTEYLPLVEAVELVIGRRLSLPSVMRWTRQGVRGSRLQSWLVGGRRMTTVNAVEEFIAEQNKEHYHNEPAKPLSEAKQALAIARANSEADLIFGDSE